MRQLADGHWVLAFADAEKSAAAKLLVHQHTVTLREAYSRHLAPLTGTGEDAGEDGDGGLGAAAAVAGARGAGGHGSAREAAAAAGGGVAGAGGAAAGVAGGGSGGGADAATTSARSSTGEQQQQQVEGAQAMGHGRLNNPSGGEVDSGELVATAAAQQAASREEGGAGAGRLQSDGGTPGVGR